MSLQARSLGLSFNSFQSWRSLFKLVHHFLFAFAQDHLGFVDALNGRIIEIATAVPSQHHTGHSDWKVELFIIPEGQSVSEAVAMLMLLKGEK